MKIKQKISNSTYNRTITYNRHLRVCLWFRFVINFIWFEYSHTIRIAKNTFYRHFFRSIEKENFLYFAVLTSLGIDLSENSTNVRVLNWALLLLDYWILSPVHSITRRRPIRGTRFHSSLILVQQILKFTHGLSTITIGWYAFWGWI